MARRVLLVLVLVAGVVAGGVLVTLRDAGAFRTLVPHFDGRCRAVPGATGPEDLTIDPEGVVWISAADRRAAMRGEPRPGAIFTYDLDRPEAGLVNRTPEAGLDFQPHGLSLHAGEDGLRRLFVVNHPGSAGRSPRHTIEIFDVQDATLTHRERLADPELLVMPNDVAAVDATRFYVTNTHAHPPGLAQTLETFLRIPGARLVAWDGERFEPALEDLRYPNGVALSADGRRLYLALTTPRRVAVYDRAPETGTLSPRREIFVGTGVDNIDVAADGALWIGAHPKLLEVRAHGEDPARRSPSQVVRVEPDTGEVEEVYLDLGDELSGVSVAAVHGDRMVLGQIFGDGILDCTLAR